MQATNFELYPAQINTKYLILSIKLLTLKIFAFFGAASRQSCFRSFTDSNLL